MVVRILLYGKEDCRCLFNCLAFLQIVVTNIATHRIYHRSKEFLLVQNCPQHSKWPFHMSLFWFKTVQAKRPTHSWAICFFLIGIMGFLFQINQYWSIFLASEMTCFFGIFGDFWYCEKVRDLGFREYRRSIFSDLVLKIRQIDPQDPSIAI